jgi:hypothetical protein
MSDSVYTYSSGLKAGDKVRYIGDQRTMFRAISEDLDQDLLVKPKRRYTPKDMVSLAKASGARLCALEKNLKLVPRAKSRRPRVGGGRLPPKVTHE